MPPFAVVRFVLIDCSTNLPVPGEGYDDLQNGVVLDRANLPQDLTIEAVTDPGEISEVQFFLDGEQIQSQVIYPYSMSSNYGNRDFKPSDRLVADGVTRTLKAVPIWWWGFEGEHLEITFSVIDSSADEDGTS